jgi:hypothetical protein
MLEAVIGDASERELRRLAVGSARLVWEALTESKSCRDAVEVGERFVEGLATEAERADAFDACVHFAGSFAFCRLPALACASVNDLREQAMNIPEFLARTFQEFEEDGVNDETIAAKIQAGRKALCDLLRKVFDLQPGK